LLYYIDLIFSRIKNTKFSKNYPTNMSCAPPYIPLYTSYKPFIEPKKRKKEELMKMANLIPVVIEPKNYQV